MRRGFGEQCFRILFIIALITVVYYTINLYTRFYYYKPIFTPFAYKLNATELVMKPGDDYRLRVMNVTKWAKFSSSDFKVADVWFTGRIHAKRVGVAIISVKVEDEVVKCKVTVVDINKKKLSLEVGEAYQLRVKGSNSSVTWTTDDKEVAVVQSDGMVSARSKGETTVTGEVDGLTFRCSVEVSE